MAIAAATIDDYFKQLDWPNDKRDDNNWTTGYKGENYTFHRLREEREKPKRQQKRVWDPVTQSLKQAKDEEGNLIYYTETA